MLNDRGNPSPSPSITSTDSLPESLQFSEGSSMPASTPTSSRLTSSSAENKKAQDRWSKEEEKLLVQLWAEKHDQLESRESRKTWAWIAEKISKTMGTKKTADKCIRKMQYVIERYKNVKDWNNLTAWRGVCSQILFSSATVAFRTNFLSLADFKSDLCRTNVKLPSSATWPKG